MRSKIKILLLCLILVFVVLANTSIFANTTNTNKIINTTTNNKIINTNNTNPNNNPNNNIIKFKIPFNKDLDKKNYKINGGATGLGMVLPAFIKKVAIPEKYEVIDAISYIKYNASPSLLPKRSSIILSINNNIYDTFLINEHNINGKLSKISTKFFTGYNDIKIESIMHYTENSCEDPFSPELWTNLNLEESYIELTLKEKQNPITIYDFISIISDRKTLQNEKINFITTNKADKNALSYYSFFAGYIGSLLQYKDVDFNVQDTLDNDSYNIIIGERKAVLEKINKIYGLSFPIPAKLEIGKSNLEQNIINKVITKDLNISNKDKIKVSFKMFWNGKNKVIPFSIGNYILKISGNAIGFNSNNKDLYGTDATNLINGWHEITAVFNNNDLTKNELYIDGKLMPLKQITGVPNVNNVKFINECTIGGLKNSYVDNFIGSKIENLKVNETDVIVSNIPVSVAAMPQQKQDNIVLNNDIIILNNDIIVLKNPNSSKMTLIITGDNDKKVKENMISFSKNDTILNKKDTLKNLKLFSPEKSKAYSSPGFLKDGEKITFKELDYTTTTFLYNDFKPMKLYFNIYPDYRFDKKDEIKTNLEIVYPKVFSEDSVINAYLNEKLAYQIKYNNSNKQDNEKFTIQMSKLIDFIKENSISSYLLNVGGNQLSFTFDITPIKSSECSLFNTKNLQTTLMDNSYIEIPKAKKWIEMPYLSYFGSAKYPFSIFPDLQDTAIYVKDLNNDNLLSAIKLSFYLGKEIKFPPYNLTATTDLTKIKDKNIIFIGKKKDLNDELFKNIKDNVIQVIKENATLSNLVFMSMFKSPYNDNKIVLTFAGENDKILTNGIEQILKPENLSQAKDDTVFFDSNNSKIYNFNLSSKYILGDILFIEKVKFFISQSPVLFSIITFLLFIILTIVLKRLLLDFKARKHKNA